MCQTRVPNAYPGRTRVHARSALECRTGNRLPSPRQRGRKKLARYLVVAHRTAETPELLAEMRQIADADRDAAFVLLVPETPLEHLGMVTADVAAAAAEQAAVRARAHFKDSGVMLEDVRVSDPNPVLAVTKELEADPGYARLIVSTFPPGISRWLRLDVPSRIERAVDIPVTHVVVASIEGD